jgi:octaprenyl-diphosphate synthase
MFTDSVQVTLLGEIQERSCLCDFTLTRADYIDIISKKSGALFALATKAAAIVSQRIPEYELDKYYQCGLNLGIAYQITDDFFDYFAHHTNKDKYCDLRQGVITLPLIYLLKKASISEQEELKGLIMQNKLTNKEIAKVTCLMYKYQVVDLVLFDLQYFTDKAKKILPGDLAVSRKVVEFINLIERKITRVGNHSAFYLHS